MAKLTDNLLELQKGFTYEDEKWHCITLGLKGDFPFLTKAGNLQRHWLRAVRKDVAKNRRTEPVGVCWLCEAGTPRGGPWEDFNLDCQWARTEVTEAWEVRPTILRLFHNERRPWMFFRPDIWHCYHGGVGKNFISSALAESLHLYHGSKDSKIEQLAADLRVWASKKGNSMPHSGAFCQERIQLTSYQVQPEASWSKFADTTTYHRFVQWLLERKRNEIQDNPLLSMVLEATSNINEAFHILYQSGLWMTVDEASRVASLGRRYIRAYANLAYRCHQDKSLRWPLVCKLHCLDHIFRRLQDSAKSSKYTWNPLGDSVQMDEEF